ncbi:rRNA methyltransferase [Actinorugispora endophytica]|uniref:rRNA methyltransferase AviRa n=1 Tax=Actinorugispora endophytica TaxID=1605990 RepID=A0A4R6V306_9ACTN|nr:rRNA methyltransferase [Actinorugispora endophytica]TDQ53070.1 RRNA methyltransferase AviRa [Actinorugispora endophytica]
MGYRYATDREDHTDLASGQVLRSAPGYPGFPVRLGSELAQRAMARLPSRPLVLWDPCCGSGYLATVVGLLHRDRLARVLASDVDAEAVRLAGRNLRLLTAEGLAERAAEARGRAAGFGKPSYLAVAESADRLARGLAERGGDLAHTVERADAFAPSGPPVPVDLVLTDVPYGDLTHWSGARPDAEPVPALLRALAAVLPDHAVLAVTARTRRVPLPGGVPALERARVGNRAAVLVRASDLR